MTGKGDRTQHRAPGGSRRNELAAPGQRRCTARAMAERTRELPHAERARHGHEQNARMRVTQRRVNHRSSTSNDQARRNSGPTERRSTPRARKRSTASCSTRGCCVSQRCTGKPNPDFGRLRWPGGNRGCIRRRTRSLPRRPRSIDQQRGVDAQHELDQPMIEQRRPHFERMRHAGPVHFGQQAFGQIRVQIEPAQLRQRREILAPELPVKPQIVVIAFAPGRARAGPRSAPPSCRRARRRKPASPRTLDAAWRWPARPSGGNSRASARLSTFDRAPTRDQ